MSKRLSELGSVALVGAGPGDPELLTVRAVSALSAADVVLFDDLVSRPILEIAGKGATRICVGKRAGRPSWVQDEINDLMIRLAKSGKRVVRLKAGDPSVFGRAGEEIAALNKAGMDVTVVPGITTASALAACSGVSLTHRACAQSLRFITAQGAGGGLPPDLDWAGLADSKTTLIVYMGKKTGGRLAAALISNGRSPATPLIVAGNVSRPSEMLKTGTLAALAGLLADWPDEGPVTIGIGETFAGMTMGAGEASGPEAPGERLGLLQAGR
ncbi:uroporphyrinogen-III C-methyltransferase [Roseibium sp.]|uniref:uroporphyrinogen-III C-methyltransferase n=1 Tax=Roseibium sp. TaxID=1936156 RepID=UPI003512219B